MNIPPLLKLEGLRKTFPGVVAVSDGTFALESGEIHALVGENGAGKSTLIKILTGAHQPDAGRILLDDNPVSLDSPLEAQTAGIAAIYQELALIPTLTVRENLFLGREKTKAGFISARDEDREARALFARLGVNIDPDALVSNLNVAQQQLVEIARALAVQARILVMDEPTAALTPREVQSLFTVLRDLAGKGIGVIFISHRLDEVQEIAHRVTVMRDGKTIGTWAAGALTRRELIEQMVGRPLEQEFPKVKARLGAPCLEVRNLSGGPIRDVSFTVQSGEVLGLAGLMGSGRTEIARLIFGADAKTSGDILLDGQPLRIRSPRDAIRRGICLLTEDRKAQGLILKTSAKDNFALPNLSRWSHWSWINRTRELARFRHRAAELNLRLSGPDQLAAHLSGGNQQKLLLARWLESNSRVVMFDEPTRGIDVGAKYEMYLLMNQLAAQGKAVIMISSELPEILGMSDRILVLRQGRIAAEIPDASFATQEEVMGWAV